VRLAVGARLRLALGERPRPADPDDQDHGHNEMHCHPSLHGHGSFLRVLSSTLPPDRRGVGPSVYPKGAESTVAGRGRSLNAPEVPVKVGAGLAAHTVPNGAIRTPGRHSAVLTPRGGVGSLLLARVPREFCPSNL